MNLYCSSKHVETAEDFSTQNSHFDIYFHLKEQWKNKTRHSFLVKCPWTKWAVFYKKRKRLQVLFYSYGTCYNSCVHSWLAHYRWIQS